MVSGESDTGDGIADSVARVLVAAVAAASGGVLRRSMWDAILAGHSLPARWCAEAERRLLEASISLDDEGAEYRRSLPGPRARSRRPDPGGLARTRACRRARRLPRGLQVLDLDDMVDPRSDLPRHREPDPQQARGSSRTGRTSPIATGAPTAAQAAGPNGDRGRARRNHGEGLTAIRANAVLGRRRDR